VSDEIRRAIENIDDVTTESWDRMTDEPDIRWVTASFVATSQLWDVDVAVMEFVRRGDPPYEDLRRAIEDALASVAGVEGVWREDTEVWLVGGSPSGRELVAAVARVVDDRADELRDWCSRLV
jgi:hypothetical protein